MDCPKCRAHLLCPECDGAELKPRRLTAQGWEMLADRSPRRPGELYPETKIQVGDKIVNITGAVSKIRVVDKT